MDDAIANKLEQRLGRLHGQGINFFHTENWYSIQAARVPDDLRLMPTRHATRRFGFGITSPPSNSPPYGPSAGGVPERPSLCFSRLGHDWHRGLELFSSELGLIP
jgi:hypothetical protein